MCREGYRQKPQKRTRLLGLSLPAHFHGRTGSISDLQKALFHEIHSQLDRNHRCYHCLIEEEDEQYLEKN